MKTILFLTSAYPYFPGEQFIEDEIGFWAAEPSVKIILVPATASGVPREIPPGITVDLTVARKSSFLVKLKSVFQALCSPTLWMDFRHIRKSRRGFRCYVNTLKTLASVLRIERALRLICKNYESLDIAYCYWNHIQAYAAVNLKRDGLISKVASRAHGFDLYENRWPDKYMPLKRQFIGDMDLMLAISNEGKAYMEAVYGASPDRVIVSRLGVPVPGMVSVPSQPNSLNIVSVSFCVALKRIDKIIDAIGSAVSKLNGFKITWSHIGDGPLLPELRLQAVKTLEPLGVEWRFLGGLPNKAVKHYFSENQVDLFINASESEGVPVSIMEAMSHGVPVIAPNVGGISEIVANESGCLLSVSPDVAELSNAIVTLSTRCKSFEVREACRKVIANKYCASKNYQSLVKIISS
jgi:colanic acid/amylovoran biosynthesis glycosyltransferase